MLTNSNVKSNCKPGDVIGVKPGYAKHFLIPRGLALRVKGHENLIQERLDLWNKNDEQAKANSVLAFQELNGKTITVEQKAGLGGSLYGSISPKDIVNLIANDDFNIHASDIHMDKIKLTGTYPIKIKLYGGTKASLTLEVKPQS